MKYINYSETDFVKDEYFQKWVLDSDSMADNFWENWLKDHPDKEDVVKRAKRLILLMNFDEDELSKNDFDGMWRNIVERRASVGREKSGPKLIYWTKYLLSQKVAAVFIGLLATGFGLYQLGIFENPSTPIFTESQITLELEDGSIKVLNESSSEVVKNDKGQIIVRQDRSTLVYDGEKAGAAVLEYNQLTVPHGKKFDLVLSDGSHVYLNSGSKLRYPVNFLQGKPRDVYLNGEAYFSVEKDEARPFTVITDEMNTQVYGTEFNVSSYKNENNTSTVLVEGSVGVYRSNNKEAIKPIAIKPGQRAVFEDNTIAVEKADVSKYIAWKENKLLFVDDRFELISKELERHFNVQIENHFSQLNHKKFTGTFEKESLDKILRIFQEHTPFDYKVEGEKITITERGQTNQTQTKT